MYQTYSDRLLGTSQSPLKVYQSQLGDKLVEDTSQQATINALEALFDSLSKPQVTSCPPIKGLYLWGDVGRGKMYLMDMFYDCLPDEGKLRLHFHHFMARIHQALNNIPRRFISMASSITVYIKQRLD
jgi:cell division protein ZapE